MFIFEINDTYSLELEFIQAKKQCTIPCKQVQYGNESSNSIYIAINNHTKLIDYKDMIINLHIYNPAGQEAILRNIDFTPIKVSAGYVYKIKWDKEFKFNNRRQAVRIPMSREMVLKIGAESQNTTGLLKDISLGGICASIYGNKNIPIGTNIHGAFVYGKDKLTYRIEGEVVRATFDESKKLTELGIEFSKQTPVITKLVMDIQLDEARKSARSRNKLEHKVLGYRPKH